ncbi:hypothetical protein JK635_07495 [Neobacillus sp. YIM B02564]|uniref:Uncharacterized protein n=1 Tax=Neobacillus paridis TaxID=2803862 RepID=A0ABS1TLI5_9BACI|nr:hypothetical protein [Neobacillus paridis]MBL4952053.1 hypothetical protein [Neobacillus paridis]
MNLNDVLTLKEVEKIWKGVRGTSEANLRNKFRNGDFNELIQKGLARKTLGGGWLVAKKAMINLFGEPEGEKYMLLTIEKRKNHQHIIGEEFKDAYSVRTEKDIEIMLGKEIENLDSEVYEQHEKEIESIYNLEVGFYTIDQGDFTYYIEIKEDLKTMEHAIKNH